MWHLPGVGHLNTLHQKDQPPREALLCGWQPPGIVSGGARALLAGHAYFASSWCLTIILENLVSYKVSSLQA